jgi:hypothetical protein
LNSIKSSAKKKKEKRRKSNTSMDHFKMDRENSDNEIDLNET